MKSFFIRNFGRNLSEQKKALKNIHVVRIFQEVLKRRKIKCMNIRTLTNCGTAGIFPLPLHIRLSVVVAGVLLLKCKEKSTFCTGYNSNENCIQSKHKHSLMKSHLRNHYHHQNWLPILYINIYDLTKASKRKYVY